MRDAPRGEYQEQNDRQARQDQTQTDGGLGVDEVGEWWPDLGRQLLQQLDGYRPIYGPLHTAHAADDEHPKQPDRIEERELLDVGIQVVLDRQPTGDAGEDVADEERLQLV